MKKLGYGLLAAAALVAGVSQNASAADMALKAAPPPVIAPTWTGFYVGGGVGSGWPQDDTNFSTSVAGVGIGLPLASQGLRGFLGGVQGGYNYQWGVLAANVDII